MDPIYWWTGRAIWGVAQFVAVAYVAVFAAMLVGFMWGAIRLAVLTHRYPQYEEVTYHDLDPHNAAGMTKDELFRVAEYRPLKAVGYIEALWIGLVHTFRQMVLFENPASVRFKLYLARGSSEYLSVSTVGWRVVYPTTGFIGA